MKRPPQTIYDRKKTLFRSFLLATLLVAGFSCQNDDNTAVPSVSPGKVTVKALTDTRIIEEIRSMVSRASSNGKTSTNPPPNPTAVLPTGYDYNNMVQVNIDGTSWTTYVAYSTGIGQNTSTNKKMIGIYYDQYGNYKNYNYTEWKYTPASSGPPYRLTYRGPEGYPNNYDQWLLDDELDVVISGGRIRPPSECGQRVSDCISHFYTQRGWFSIGLTLGTIVAPEIAVGVVGGCMLGCALGY